MLCPCMSSRPGASFTVGPGHLAGRTLAQALLSSLLPTPSCCLPDAALWRSVCFSPDTWCLVSASLGTGLKLAAPWSSSRISDFQEVNTAQLGQPFPPRPVSCDQGLRSPSPPAAQQSPENRLSEEGLLNVRTHPSRGSPSLPLQHEVWRRGTPCFSPQNTDNFAPGLPGNLGKTEPEVSLRTGLHLVGL